MAGEIQTTPTIPSNQVAPAPAGAGDLGMASTAAPVAPATTMTQPAAPMQTAQHGKFLQGVTFEQVAVMAIILLALTASIYSSYRQVKFLNVKESQAGELDELKADVQTIKSTMQAA
ncbi:MAG TPA: hypothetical protein VFV08_14735 [Puia sp.]|nr:hypothetical protein [Puia sp.]